MKKNDSFTSYLLPTALAESVFRGWSAFILVLGILASINNAQLRFITCAAIALAAVLVILTRRKRHDTVTAEAPKTNLLCFVLIAFLSLLSYFWALRFDSIQASDFGVYFRCSTEVHSSIQSRITSCQSQYLHPNLLYWSRSLLYSIPFGIFSGPNYGAFKLYNASLHVATIFLLFFGLRNYFGSRTAITATLILTFYPEWWFTTTLVTSDNAAVLVVAAFLLLLPQLERNRHFKLTVAALSCTMFVGNQLRTIGPMLAATLVFWVVLSQISKPSRATLIKGIVVFVLYVSFNAILSRLTPFSSPDPVQFVKYLFAVDFSSPQDFSVNYRWFEHFWRAIPPLSGNNVGWSKALLEFTWGFDQLPTYLYKKAAVFFSGTGYYFFSSTDIGPNPDTVFTVPKNTIPVISSAFPWMTAAVAFICALSLFSLFRAKLHGPALAAMLWLSSFTIMVLGLGEVQPRYSVLVAPALSILAAVALSSPGVKQDTVGWRSADVKARNIVIAFLLATIVFGIIVLGLKAWRSVEITPSQSAKVVTNSLCESRLARVETSYKRVRIVMPKGTSCAAISVAVNPFKRSLSFFVSGTNFPFPFEPKVFSPFHYVLLSQGETLLESSLGDASVKWHQLDLSVHSATKEIVLTVQRQNIRSDDSIDFWFF